MKNNILNKIIGVFALSLGVFFTSCNKEDYTNDSMMTPASTNVSITLPFTSVTLVEDDSSYNIPIGLSSKQNVDVRVYLKVVGGTAAESKDYKLDHYVTIPAGSTSTTAKIQILRDQNFEPTETLIVQIGGATTANAEISPKTIEFTILNYTEGDLKISYSWNPVAYDPISGAALSQTQIADMVLEVYNPDGSLLAEVDGAGFEAYVLNQSVADGIYTIKSSFYDAMNFGGSVVMPQTLDFSQVGVFEDSFSYPDLADVQDGSLCNLKYTLATITKSGTSYSINYTPAKLFSIDPATFNGVYVGLDGSIGPGSAANYRFDNPVTVSNSGGNISGLNVDWMTNIWGETVTSVTPINIVLNNDGTLTIPLQPYMTTTYSGAPYSYSISGTGTWNSCNPKKLHIEYDMFNVTDDFSLGVWLKANNYSFTNYFIADITLQ